MLKLSLNNILSVSKKDRKQELKTIAFHPNDSLAFLVVDNEVYVADIISGAFTSKFKANVGEIVDVCASAVEPLVASLILDKEETLIQILNFQLQSCKSIHNITKNVSAKKGPVILGVSAVQPKLFYSQSGSKTIFVLDMSSGAKSTIDAKKPISALAFHPFKAFLACAHSDGTVKIFNTATGATTHTFMDISSENPNSPAAKEKTQPNLTMLAFHPSRDIIVASSAQGSASCWDFSSKEPFLGTRALASQQQTVLSIYFHPTTALLLVLDKEGFVTPFFFFQVKDKWLTSLPNAPALQPSSVESKSKYAHLPSYVHMATEQLAVQDMRIHSKFNYISYIFKRVGKPAVEEFKISHLLDSIRVSVYSIDTNIVPSNLHLIRQLPMDFFTEPERDDKGKNTFYFPNEVFYLDGYDLMAFSPAYNDVSLAITLPTQDSEGLLFRPTKLVYSQSKDRFLAFFESVNPSRENFMEYYCCVVTKDMETKDIVPCSAARDGVFVGTTGEFLILSENGRTAELLHYTGDIVIPKPYSLPSTMSAVFSTPLNDGNTVLFYDASHARLIGSSKTPLNHQEMKYKLDNTMVLPMGPEEVPMQIVWQESYHSGTNNEAYGAVLTNHRLRIVNAKMKVLAEYKDKGIVSCLWAGATILFTTNTHLFYMTVLGAALPLLSLQHPEMYLAAVLCDRVTLCVHRNGQAVMVSIAVGLMEPLTMGILDMSKLDINFDRPDVEKMIKSLSQSFDGKRISMRLIEELISSDESELALQLLVANPHLLLQRMDLAWKMALRSHHFNTAYSILTHPSSQYTQSKLHRKLKKLAQICTQYGQFDVARRCYELVQDGPSLLYLSLVSKNKAAADRLLAKVKKDPGYCDGLQKACEQQLPKLPIYNDDHHGTETPTPPSSFSASPSFDTSSSPTTPPSPLTTNSALRRNSQGDAVNPPAAQPKGAKQAAAKLPPPIKEEKEVSRPLLDNMRFVSEKEHKRWKIEVEAKIACEMKTRNLARGSGSHVIGPLLISKLLSDWFARQVPHFQLPTRLLSEEYRRRTSAENLEAMAEERMRIRGGLGPSAVSASAQDEESPRFKRTFTIGGLVGSGATPGAPGSHPPSHPTPADPSKPKVRSTTMGTAILPDPAVVKVPAPIAPATTRAGRTNTLTGPPPSEDMKGLHEMNRMSSVGALPKLGVATVTNAPPTLTVSSPNGGDITPRTREAAAAAAAAANTLHANDYFKMSLWKLEQADYSGSLIDLSSCLQHLASETTDTSQKKTVFVVKYKMALQVLMEIRREEEGFTTSPARLAFLSSYLSRLPLLRRHKLILMRMAIRRNFECENYGVASSLIELLVKKFKLPDTTALMEKLAKCKEAGNTDAAPLPSMRVCYKTVKIINKPTAAKCKYCDAIFSEDSVPINTYCPCCYHRTLTKAENK